VERAAIIASAVILHALADVIACKSKSKLMRTWEGTHSGYCLSLSLSATQESSQCTFKCSRDLAPSYDTVMRIDELHSTMYMLCQLTASSIVLVLSATGSSLSSRGEMTAGMAWRSVMILRARLLCIAHEGGVVSISS
jgi:hypothetical protein